MSASPNPTTFNIPPLNDDTITLAQHRLDSLTKPPGSLGRLEELAVHIAGITACVGRPLSNKTVVVMAGDHGVVAEGVSAYPQSVTAQMVANFLAGGAAINVLAKTAGARVRVVDMGVVELGPHPDLDRRNIAFGTANIVEGPAMSRQDTQGAIDSGAAIADDEIGRGADLIATGEMGIGNTTPSAAIVSVLLDRPAAEIVGPGAGLDGDGVSKKAVVVERAIAVNTPDPHDPIGVLAKLGGFEIAGLVGVILRAAELRRPVLLDGFITSAAALVACRFAPPARDYLIASHASAEPGHRAVLDDLGLKPLLDLDLRLGEGSGAALAMPLVDAAIAILNDMATFEQAGVDNRPDRA